MSAQDFDLSYLVGLFGVVAFGAVIPVLPTGAAVSVAAVLSEADNPLLLVLVVAVGGAGAYLGDIVTYAALKLAGRPLAERVGWLQSDAPASTLERFSDEVRRHELRTLLLSRLVPGGRIPVLLAAALGGYSWRRFAVADIAAALLWSSVYAAIGLAGRSIFPKPWQGILAAIAVVILVSVLGQWWRRRHPAPAEQAATDEADRPSRDRSR